MAARNLQDVIDQSGDVVEMLRNSQIGAYIYPVVPYEFTNWRREQRAWRETAVLFDQSHHMVNFWFKGPDALRLVQTFTSNNAASLKEVQAQYTYICNEQGGVNDDSIVYNFGDHIYVVVNAAPLQADYSWLQQLAGRINAERCCLQEP